MKSSRGVGCSKGKSKWKYLQYMPMTHSDSTAVELCHQHGWWNLKMFICLQNLAVRINSSNKYRTKRWQQEKELSNGESTRWGKISKIKWLETAKVGEWEIENRTKYGRLWPTMKELLFERKIMRNGGVWLFTLTTYDTLSIVFFINFSITFASPVLVLPYKEPINQINILRTSVLVGSRITNTRI